MTDNAAMKPVAWMTGESLYRLERGGNGSRNTVPVHVRQSNVAKIPLYLASTIEKLQGDHAAALESTPPAITQEQLKLAYASGWHACAHWAARPDLHHDVGSKAYTQQRDAALENLNGHTWTLADTIKEPK